MSDIHDHLHHDEPMPEGEEAAPPYTHTMAIVRWVILGVMAIFALVMVLSYFGAAPWSASKEGAVMYHCPMHPTYVSSQPGECPICGMSLVPIDAKVDADSAAKAAHGAASAAAMDSAIAMAKPGDYACPMDPEVVSHGPGKCPKCGMALVQIPDTLLPGPAKTGQYYCPMHTYVVSDKPGDCPLCGMALVEATAEQPAPGQNMPDMPGMAAPTEKPAHVTPDTAMTGMDMGEAPVPGLVPVTLEPKRLQLINVRTDKVERRSLASTTHLVGFVAPDESKIANVNVRVSGWVQKLVVDQTGQQVRQGQPLLTIYSQDLYQAQQDFLLAQATAGQSSNDSVLTGTRNQILDAARERLRLLGMSTQEVDQLASSGKVSNEVSLRSPVTGVVLAKSVLPGQFVNPDQSLYTVADLRSIWVLADAYESDLSQLKVGQPVRMTVTSFPGEVFEGKVAFIYPTVSEQTRTLKVRLEFPNPDARLRPGMYADVELLGGGNEQVLAVPRSAVMEGGDVNYAFVVHEGGHFEPRLLTIGRTTDDVVEVLSGLREGETVLTSANFLIDSESRLKAAISGMGGGQVAGEHAGHGK